MGAIVNFFVAGGSWMWAILLTMIVAMAIIIERFIVLNFKNRIDSAAFVNRILELIQRGNIANAVELCSMSQAALPRITRAGLEEFMKNPAEVQHAMEVAAMSEIPKIEKRTSYLSLLANIATLLGLLGTIFGLIDSFAAVTNADASQKAALLASGIAVAMNTTAFGLIVAIPTLIFYSMLNERISAITDEINENTARIFQRLSRTRITK
ncbi:MAG: MotA/TolQ/ExbB proton channel family protein [candidate division KSB1 bacterium]|nr:MotA/TolQ/ExbB proton channel family protein [candidate division KSB1 bacterium]MDZ7274541.1 MotA/TolQ/ExbB proton channel family protein [candidate division KSB1 bacterium]MDZ7284798.1 MotA/TolQ/ExbB proton channel family protein [candidate division KSB1 bacterium]MDZ7297782.1 MotA/TolQ/ExbB proton channel family protein [candidate division KSB1 bacterium]MDZ7306429.1 MotA/TolQ/ExbB proton channel family protein [candidate division KSB1 bacterium]